MAAWTFEDGMLIARKEDGELLWAWMAEAGVGWSLADLLKETLIYSPPRRASGPETIHRTPI